MYAGVALMASTGRGTRVSVISNARVFPDPGSGERNAIRGVDSQTSIMCVCPIQSACATWVCSDGYAINRPRKPCTRSNRSAPLIGAADPVDSTSSSLAANSSSRVASRCASLRVLIPPPPQRAQSAQQPRAAARSRQVLAFAPRRCRWRQSEQSPPQIAAA